MGPSRPLLRDSGAAQPPPCRGTLAVGGHDAENCVAHRRASIRIENVYQNMLLPRASRAAVQRKRAFGAPLSCPNTPPKRVQKDKRAQPRAAPLRERPAEASRTCGRSLERSWTGRNVPRGGGGWGRKWAENGLRQNGNVKRQMSRTHRVRRFPVEHRADVCPGREILQTLLAGGHAERPAAPQWAPRAHGRLGRGGAGHGAPAGHVHGRRRGGARRHGVERDARRADCCKIIEF